MNTVVKRDFSERSAEFFGRGVVHFVYTHGGKALKNLRIVVFEAQALQDGDDDIFVFDIDDRRSDNPRELWYRFRISRHVYTQRVDGFDGSNVHRATSRKKIDAVTKIFRGARSRVILYLRYVRHEYIVDER